MMALDHYISQVYLRNFYASELGNRMYAFRKTDLKRFTPPSDDVCRIKDHSTNPYLEDPRVIEEFLKSIEPKLNQSISELAEGKVTRSTVYVIAGFVSFISVCSPASMRIHSEPMKQHLGEIARNLDKSGQLPPPPPELGANSLVELLEKGDVDIDVDQKYPQAMGITSILKFTNTFGNSKWDVLHNDIEDSPFFTSDFPLALEPTYDPAISMTLIPLTPKLALRIMPTRDAKKQSDDFTFPEFGFRTKKLTRKQVAKMNRNIVRCAETHVFSSHMRPWVSNFVSKNRMFRIESITSRLPTEEGAYLISTKKVIKKES